jgi:medium-chain acyl-[acyl-carrier-protein] hydrolase
MISPTLTKPCAWLARLNRNPQASLRLFGFPYSGASASMYYRWVNQLPASIDVCPVELPGRGNRLLEPPFTRIGPLVRAAAQALLPHLDRPFAFFGHSMGALVSFELARHLRRMHGLIPVRVFVSGHAAPHLPDREPPLHTLPEPEFVEKLRALDGTPVEVLEHAELRELILPILRADFAVCETYTYEPGDPLDCPISAFGGLQDPHVTRDDLDAWREHTRVSFSSQMFAGNHFFINTAQPLVLRSVARDLPT